MDSERLRGYLKELDAWRDSYGVFPQDESARVPVGEAVKVLDELVLRLKDDYPFHHPQYAGQMLKPPHEIAMQAYLLAMTINPNNHALDGGPATSVMEKEVITQMAEMAGYGSRCLGHLTGGGTIANLEALWVARESHPDKSIAFSSAAHYTHPRMCRVLDIPAREIATGKNGKMNPEALEKVIGEIGTVVVTMGTTGLGLVEDLPAILAVCRANNVRVHADAAYGGFFTLLKSDGAMDGEPWQVLQEADSIVIDPHKHGLQPYGCGCVLFRDPSVGRFYKHDSPYTYFSSEDLHLGEISLECSRSGASAAALWATLRCFPLREDGLGRILHQCRMAALECYDSLLESPFFIPLIPPELDILAYFPRTTPLQASRISDLSRRIFESGMEDTREGLHLSLLRMSSEEVKNHHPELRIDQQEIVVLRSVFMKPEHRRFIPEFIRRLEKLWKTAAQTEL